MKKLNIWLIQPGEPLPIEENVKKMRTAHLADKLIEKGHSVVWWTSAFDHFKKDWIFHRDTEMSPSPGVKIKAMKGTGYSRNMSVSRFIDHRLVAQKFKQLSKRMEKPNIIIASTPPHDLAYQAVQFAKKEAIPVIVDIRDEWPDLFVKGVPFMLRPFIRMLLWRDFQMIRKTLRRADGLVAMMGSLLDWGLMYAGRQRGSQDRIFWLGDKKTEGNLHSSRPLPFLEELKGKFVVTFLGTFVRNNNPSILIECAKKLRDIPICFVLAGDGELLDEMKRLSASLPNVLLPGWLQEEELRALLRHSHVGVCPTAQDREAFPNKTFSYLSAGLPILSAFHGEIEDLIERHGIGFYFPFQDADALAACILKLYEDRVQYEKMANNAKILFDEMFDADKIYDDYARHIEMIADTKQPPTS